MKRKALQREIQFCRSFNQNCLYHDKELWNKTHNETEVLISPENGKYPQNKLKNISKTKDLYKILKDLIFSKNFSVIEINTTENSNKLNLDLNPLPKPFVNLYSTLAGSLIK